MKKTLVVVSVMIITLVVALGIAGYAVAQTGRQWSGGMMGGSNYSRGMMNGSGYAGSMMNGYGMSDMMGAYGSYGPMHQYMVDALADALGISPEELQARVEAGEAMWDIARAEGLTNEEITTVMQSAHELAIEQAVADGVITQEQAEWMNDHMLQMHGGGAGFGSCHGTGSDQPGSPGNNAPNS